MSSLLGSLFFLDYFFFQIPGALYAANRSAKKLIFWSLILWGALAMATGMVSNVNWLIVIRFMLGVVESAVMPSMLVFLSRWFTKAEPSRANTFLILGNPATILWMSILSGYLVASVGWRWMFIIEGFPAILWPFLLIGAMAFYGSYLLGTSSFWLSFVLLVLAGGAMYAPYGPFFAVNTQVLP